MTTSLTAARGLAPRLRAALSEADYLLDPIQQRIGDAGQAGLARNTTIAAGVALGPDEDPQATLTRLFILQQSVERRVLENALPGLVDDLVGAGILTAADAHVRAAVDIRPYGSDDGEHGWVVSDLTPGLNHDGTTTRGDWVLGVSPASTTLAQMTMRRPVHRALDLGTGCGVQSLHLARHTSSVVATELNPRAVELAGWTFALSGVDVDLRQGDLYAPVADETFDLIVTNPPYVMSPPQHERLVYREAGLRGDELVERVVREGADRLAPGGCLQVLGNWAQLAGVPWQDRLAEWVPDDLDVLVMQREELDRFEYIEMWLADAGLNGTTHWEPRYRQWLDYFTELNIESVGMGWILVQRPASPRSTTRRFDSWPHAVAQPVGEAFAAFAAAAEWVTRTDADLLATRWRLTSLDQETIGRPGSADPEHVVLRSRSGFCRAVEVDTALGGVLGACDGDLPLGVLVAAVADLLGVSADALRGEVLGQWRQLLVEGYLTPCE